MSLQDMMDAVASLSADEMRQLREFIEQQEQNRARPQLDIEAIEQISADLREGFSDEDTG